MRPFSVHPDAELPCDVCGGCVAVFHVPGALVCQSCWEREAQPDDGVITHFFAPLAVPPSITDERFDAYCHRVAERMAFHGRLERTDELDRLLDDQLRIAVERLIEWAGERACRSS
jgi:hypothetical protein